jgi:hypothetical protein
MFKPMMPYAIFYTQKFLYEINNTQSDLEEIRQEEQVGAYVGTNGRNYLLALKKRMDSKEDSHRPTITTNSNDLPIFTYDSFKYNSKVLSLKDFQKAPDYSKHFVIKEYSFSIFHPPKEFI